MDGDDREWGWEDRLTKRGWGWGIERGTEEWKEKWKNGSGDLKKIGQGKSFYVDHIYKSFRALCVRERERERQRRERMCKREIGRYPSIYIIR